MKIYVDINDTSIYQQDAPFPNSVEIGPEFTLADVPYLTIIDVDVIETRQMYIIDGNDEYVLDIDGNAQLLLDGNGDPMFEDIIVEVKKVAILEESGNTSKIANELTSLRGRKLRSIREFRAPLIAEADIEINKIDDLSGDSSAWRAYRQALRVLTDSFKDGAGDATSAVDAVSDVGTDVSWPVKP